jgi:hypothetical protein
MHLEFGRHAETRSLRRKSSNALLNQKDSIM